MRMSELEAHAATCLNKDLPLKVLIDMPGFESPEIIVNPPENIERKLEYYKSTYDENCNHKHAEGISIVAVVHSDGELGEFKEGTALLPYVATQLNENHVRYEHSYNVGNRSKTESIEGKVEDVLKIIQQRRLTND